MNHTECKEMVPFYLYEELELEKQKQFEDHIRSCKDCSSELESIKKLFADISEDSKSTINPNLLLEARLELRGVLRAQKNKVPISNNIKKYISSFIYKPIGLAVGSFSLVVIGMFFGYLIFNSPLVESIETASTKSNPFRIQNINFIDPDPSDGQVEFTFESITPGRIKGNINDSEVQKILTYAVLNEQNPGTRLNSINVINANQTRKPDEEIKRSTEGDCKITDESFQTG